MKYHSKDELKLAGLRAIMEGFDKRLTALEQRMGTVGGGQPHRDKTDDIAGRNYNSDRSLLDNPAAFQMSPDFEKPED